jgi:hydrogenase expression/formation protein HypE
VAEAKLAEVSAHPLGTQTVPIGAVVGDHAGKVFMRSRIGGLRVVDMLTGEQLPRVC